MSWDEDVDELVGSSLRVLRTNADMTQGELAERLAAHGVPMSQQTIAKIESGSRSLRLSEAVAIVQALNDGDNDLRLEHLVATPYELGLEMESQRIVDNVLAEIDRLSDSAKELTLWTLAARSFLEENPDADGVASRKLNSFTRGGADAIFNIVKAGIRQALEDGSYADEASYQDAPDYAKSFIDAIGESDADA
ncbi:helix-turn-helix transcriptional regulator [Mycolicibacterium neoaurum]|uniref:helix-turn-helix transcriptional regulator n=1 Tax=Mycolicibacterium neoaurum TaxID=1795 RepID=UPI001F4CC13D|nr:helix-turn-helix transcriptional regulator [Mycolicibacterium neoaurum]